MITIEFFPLVFWTDQNNLNGITSLAWKSEWVALGDAEGNVAIWEWRTRHFRPLPHTRSPIRKLRFAPGKNNMKLIVLHMDGVDIWDVRGKLIWIQHFEKERIQYLVFLNFMFR